MLLALGVWLGALVIAGVSAASIFSQLHTLHAGSPDIVIPAEDQWKFLGGKAQNGVFRATDGIQAICGVVVAGATLRRVFRFAMSLRTWRWRLHLAIVGMLFAITSAYFLLIMIPMQQALYDYWYAASHNLADMPRLQARFDAYHPFANRCLSCIALTNVASIATLLFASRSTPEAS